MLCQCRAARRQLQQGKHTHNHQPAIDAANTAQIKVAVMKKATENLFKPASAIVDEVRPS